MNPQEYSSNYNQLFSNFRQNLMNYLSQGMVGQAIQKAGRASGPAINARVVERINQMAHQAALQAAGHMAPSGPQYPHGGGGSSGGEMPGWNGGKMGGLLSPLESWDKWMEAPVREAQRNADIAEAEKRQREATDDLYARNMADKKRFADYWEAARGYNPIMGSITDPYAYARYAQANSSDPAMQSYLSNYYQQRRDSLGYPEGGGGQTPTFYGGSPQSTPQGYGAAGYGQYTNYQQPQATPNYGTNPNYNPPNTGSQKPSYSE